MHHTKKLTSCLVLLLLMCTHDCNAGKWIVSLKTSNNWMAGFVGDVSVCLTLRSTKAVIPKLPSTASADNVTATTTETSENNFPTLDDPDDAALGDQPSTPGDSDQHQVASKEECQSLPWRHFERGKPYLFGLDYESSGNKIDRARLFAKPIGANEHGESSSCKRQSVDVWHLDEITFQNLESGQLFEKRHRASTSVKPVMQLESRCEGTTSSGSGKQELILESFVVSLRKRPCVFDGAIYKDGESFEDGCSAACRCEDGGIACVSRCPPSLAPSCREVYVPGQCCPTHACEKSAAAGKISCPLYENHDCETANRTVDPGEFPWTAFVKLCGAKGCKRFCSGALLNEQWILTAADCFAERQDRRVSAADDARVIIGEHTLILAEDRDVEIGVQNVTISPPLTATKNAIGHLALIKLKEPVVFDRAVQPATLPSSREQCLTLVQSSCALSLAGWINIGSPEQEQYELYKISTRVEDQRVCDQQASTTPPTSSNVLPSSRKRKPPPPPPSGANAPLNSLCIDLANDEPALQPECGACSQASDNSSDSSCPGDKNAYLCTGEKGRTLISKVQIPVAGGAESVEVNYVVGIISYGLANHETAAGLCRKSAYRMALSVCHDLNWINSVIRDGD